MGHLGKSQNAGCHAIGVCTREVIRDICLIRVCNIDIANFDILFWLLAYLLGSPVYMECCFGQSDRNRLQFLRTTRPKAETQDFDILMRAAG